MARATAAIGSLMISGMLTGCLVDAAAPTTTEMIEALQAYVAETEGSTDAKGRYRGPQVGKVENLKCVLVDPKQESFKCSYTATVRRTRKEEDTETRTFRKTEVEIEARGKSVKKKLWRVTTG
jgi:hypothetical protein